MNFITPEEWQAMKTATSPNVLNEILTRMHHRTVEDALRSMPELISRLVRKSQTMQQTTAEFFDKNKDFKDHKAVVAEAVMQVELKNPTADYSTILELATPEIAKTLRSTQVANIDRTFAFKGE